MAMDSLLITHNTLLNNALNIKHWIEKQNQLGILHFHNELELKLVLSGSGELFVGDKVIRFKKGDIFFLGERLSHKWVYDRQYVAEGTKKHAVSLVAHFGKFFMGNTLFSATETKKIRDLFEIAENGILYRSTNGQTIRNIKKLESVQGFKQLLLFFEILNELSERNDAILLASEWYKPPKDTSYSRIQKVHEFIMAHYKEDISQDQVAKLINMSPSVFSHFFKRSTKKTFSDYLNYIRIAFACKLLLETDQTVAQICFESGYDSLSNFNKQFRKRMNISPKQYRQ